MKSLRLLAHPTAVLLALMASLTIPVIADDHIDLHMTFDRFSNAMFDADTGGPPFFDNPYNATGHVNINNINIPQATARIIALQVEFDVDLCGDPDCTTIIDTLHFKAYFDDTVGQAMLNDPHDPNSLSVTASSTGGTVHRNGGGEPDTVIQDANFSYTQTPALVYSVNFTFFSSEFQANLSVALSGPPPPAP
jgi:hypothetical protein